MSDLINRESIWKRITRLFRAGPIVRHKIAAGEKLVEPHGTASPFKKEISNLYIHSLASYGQYERLARLADFAEMEQTPEIANGLNIIADEVTSYDENGRVLHIRSKNKEIDMILHTLFFDIINIEFHAWSWVRNLVKNGDMVLIVDANEQNGILNLVPVPINEIEREEGYDKDDPFAVRFRWMTQGNKVLENWQVIHFRLLGNDSFLPYGSSMLEPARRIWRQLILIEDAMMVYRIIRAPERRVFKIDVGMIPNHQVEEYMEKVKTKLKRNQIIDPSTGRVDLRYNPLSVEEDYFLAVRDGQASDISTLPGGQMVNDIADVEYIQNKLFAALGIPKPYLGYTDSAGSKATLSQQDVRFSRTIERIQKVVIAELNKIAIIHLFLLGFTGEDLVDFELKLTPSSTIAEQQKLELWRMKFEIANMAQEGVFDRGTIYREIFRLSDEQIEKIKEGRKLDKLEDMLLEQVKPPEEAGNLEGEEELPDTLGGEPGAAAEGSDEGEDTPAEGEQDAPDEAGEQPEASGLGPENASMRRLGLMLLENRRNKGPLGITSDVSINTGKDMFSTTQNPLQLTMPGRGKRNAKKQRKIDTGLDDIRRVVSRPFASESEEKLMDDSVDMIDEVEEMCRDFGKTLL